MLPPLGGIVDRPVATRKGMRTNFLCILFTVGLNYFYVNLSQLNKDVLKIANEKSQFELITAIHELCVFFVISIATLEVGLISIVETFLLSIATLRITSLFNCRSRTFSILSLYIVYTFSISFRHLFVNGYFTGRVVNANQASLTISSFCLCSEGYAFPMIDVEMINVTAA
ncbi:hypothetical protein ACJX0J_034804, partial [Zea mays]